MSEEVWKYITGTKDYMISNFGRIKSLKYSKIRMLKTPLNADGYKIVRMSNYGKQKTRTVHQLVAEEFLNHTPSNMELVINHKDLNRLNNHIDNLEIVTNRKNTMFKTNKLASKYIGVTMHKQTGKWRAKIYINKKNVHLGLFLSEIEANEAYQKALKTTLINK